MCRQGVDLSRPHGLRFEVGLRPFEAVAQVGLEGLRPIVVDPEAANVHAAELWEGNLNLLRAGNRSFWRFGRPRGHRKPFQKPPFARVSGALGAAQTPK
jgi:hypothetical protein